MSFMLFEEESYFIMAKKNFCNYSFVYQSYEVKDKEL